MEKDKDFFVTYLNGKPNVCYHNPTTDFSSYFISFDDCAQLELMTHPELVEQTKHPYRNGYSHIAFSVPAAAALRLSENSESLFFV